MIEIERLRMRLPTGFEHRATSIARMVAEGLAAKHLQPDTAFDAHSVSLRPRKISPYASDREIAGLIVEDLAAAVQGRIV